MSHQHNKPRNEVWMYVKDGARIRRRRRDKGISQVQLAALAGCTQQYVSLIEQGLDRDVSEKIAERICRYLDVSVEDYFEERRAVRMPRVATHTRGSSRQRRTPSARRGSSDDPASGATRTAVPA